MKLQNIGVNNFVLSETNIKGRTKENLKELTDSIKEKGVLMPVLVRKAGDFYEVIAGNRRVCAAIKAGLTEVPAQIVEMNDIEAREAQIVENLQREGVHPLDEGEQYRELIEVSKYEIPSVAAKVAKSVDYVKQRLFLTNLIKPASDAYRAGKIVDGHAVLIAKLSTADQTRALKAVSDRWNKLTVKELKEWIDENIYTQLDNQPWLKLPIAHMIEAVGECLEGCGSVNESLFGPVREGACTSVKCWKIKMDKWLNYRAKNEKLAKISSEYGQSPKGILGRNDYTVLSKKKEDQCESARKAIVVAGSELGKVIMICSNKKCNVHYGAVGEYRKTPAEIKKAKEDRKKELEKSKKEKEARENKLKDALKKIKWPLSNKHLEALLELSMEQASSLIWNKVAKRHELEVKKEKTSWGGSTFDYEKAVKKFIETLDKTGKARMAFELLIDTGYDNLREGIKKI